MPDTVTHYFRYTTDDVSDTTPSWTDATDLVRSFSISRGRENELADVDAGTAQVVLDNRGRDFDPVANPLIRPMNRWWLQVVHPGGTDDLFFGYAESYQQEWPGAGGRDAVCVVHLVDEFKVLALDTLPTTDPPRDTYADVVLFDQPAVYWRMNDDSIARSRVGVVGPELVVEGTSVSSLNDGAIVGDNPDPYGAFYNAVSSYAIRRFEAGDNADPLVVAGLTAFTIECWFDTDDITPASQEILIHGPTTGGATSWRLFLNTGGTVAIEARNSAGTLHTATSGVLTAGSPPSSPTWKHIVGTIEGGSLRLYVNGTQVASTAWTGPFHATFNAGSSVYVSDLAPLSSYVFDEVAFYRVGLSAARVLAHYEAGRLRGFARGEDPGPRIESVLDAAGNAAARNVRTGTRAMVGTYMRGQSPLEEIRRAELADNVDAVFFIAKDGTITFLDDGHRSVSPWNAVQATFDDDGTDLPYLSVTVDDSDSFLYNVVSVAKQGGTLVTDDDATSIAEFFRRPLPLGELPITTDGDVTSVAAALIAKYKDPMTRVTGLSLTTGHAGIAAAVFPLEIGDRIRVLRTPPSGGGSRIDQTVFIQKISVSGAASSPYWNITLNVSPL